MRLIDADEIIARLHDDGLISSQLVALQKIANMPTIDAVPVVRCKDCRNGCRIDGHEDRVWCNHWDFDSDKNDFCSYGERKEETE